MSGLTLVIGNMNYSSWSLRPWLVLKATGAPFTVIRIPLDRPETKARIGAHSPTGKVPVLKDGALTIWDSLAICEYLAEKFPAARLWPETAAVRAMARAVTAEMHSGFAALRQALPMDIRRRERREIDGAVAADITRIREIWNACRAVHGQNGPWLFGRYSIADAFYAPVATRFRTYGVGLDPVSDAYVEASLTREAMREWIAAAEAEPETIG
ncbi:MAG: glutathione S-transferase family protein [Alphaproteobacteria bacterium]|nr:glutathione S-transferase family protein [Alphaproteobacteria bacterium]